MKKKLLKNVVSAIFTCYASIALSAPWSHENQEEWGTIRDDSHTEVPKMYPYATCSIGTRQSPVNLGIDNHKDHLYKLHYKYSPDKPVFFNTGDGIQVNTSDDYQGQLMIGELAYPLIQFHFHEPSEHVLGEKQFPAELHFVHIRADGRIAVLGVLIEEGEGNPTFQTILDNMPTTGGGQNDHSGIQVNPASLLPEVGKRWNYYTLAGSLTTPPCSEGVHWFVLSEPITISQAQLAQLKSFYTGNARHTQDLNGRSVSRRN